MALLKLEMSFRNPATFLHAYTCLPLSYATRQAAGAILQDVADSGILFAMLMCRHKVRNLFFLLPYATGKMLPATDIFRQKLKMLVGGFYSFPRVIVFGDP